MRTAVLAGLDRAPYDPPVPVPVDVDAVRGVADTVPGLVALYLFGSRARGDDHPGSDVDLAILCAAPLEPLARFELQQQLAELLRADVDLVDLAAASTVMRVRVLADGEVLVDREPTTRARFEATALSAYTRLNEERRGIVEDALRSGRIHG